MNKKLQNQSFESGIIGSQGACVAPCYVFKKRIEVEQRHINEEQIPEEIKRLDEILLLVRGAVGWTAQEFGDRIGVTRQTIISIEQGKYIASLPLAIKIAKVFGVPVEKVFILKEGD